MRAVKHIPLSALLKRTQRLTFWARRLPAGVGGLPREGVGSKSSCPLSKVFFFGPQGMEPAMSREFAGMSQITGVVQRVSAKKVCAHFVFPIHVVKFEGVALLCGKREHGTTIFALVRRGYAVQILTSINLVKMCEVQRHCLSQIRVLQGTCSALVQACIDKQLGGTSPCSKRLHLYSPSLARSRAVL